MIFHFLVDNNFEVGSRILGFKSEIDRFFMQNDRETQNFTL